MVRFHWHVEDGLGASVGPGQLVYLRDHGVLQAMVDMEMPGQAAPLETCMNIPANYNTDTGVKELGFLIAHGTDASDWRGRLLGELAVALARAGFLVSRYIAPHDASEAHQVAVFEKAADVAATSPYARGVTRWVLAGIGSGARVAAAAGPSVRSGVAGYVLMSYPLREEMPPAETDPTGPSAGREEPSPPTPSPSAPDSSGPLLSLSAPVLFLTASNDPWVNEHALLELAPRMASQDVRSVVLQDVDPHFRTLTGKGPHAATVRIIAAAVLEFLNAAGPCRMDLCKLPRLWRGGSGMAAGGGGEGGEDRKGRPQLQRPACFRPLPSGPPAQPELPSPQPQQLQQQLLAAAAAAGQALPYGLSTSAAAQALAAQLQQRQATAAAAASSAAAASQQTQLLTQQMLLQQAAAAAVQRRTSDHQQTDVGPAAMAAKLQQAALAAAAARGGGAAGLAQALADPATAAQVAAALLRSQQQQAAGGGGGGGSAVSVSDALTALIQQRLAQQQQQQQQQQGMQQNQGSSATQLLAATLLKQQQQQSGAGSGGAASIQQQQLQQLLLQHTLQQHQQQQPQQQHRQQSGLQQALLLQNNAAALQAALRSQAAAAAAGGGISPAGSLGPGSLLMLQNTPSGQLAPGFGAGAAGRHDEDVDMGDGADE